VSSSWHLLRLFQLLDFTACCDLATNVFPQIDVLKNELVLDVVAEPVLESEYKLTKAAQYSPRPCGQRRVGRVRPRVPADAILGLSECIDYDTDVGRFLEIVVPRVKAQSFLLQPPKPQILQPKSTRAALQHGTQPKVVEEASKNEENVEQTEVD